MLHRAVTPGKAYPFKNIPDVAFVSPKNSPAIV